MEIHRWIFDHILQPHSREDEPRRREYILNIILSASVILSFCATMILWVGRRGDYSANTPLMPLAIMVFFLILYTVSRFGYSMISAYVMVGIYLLSTFSSLKSWGADLPQGLLMCVAVIVMSSVLISTGFALIIMLVIAGMLYFLARWQLAGMVAVDSAWRSRQMEMPDIIIYIVTMGVVMVVSWLSNREIEKSLKRARSSEQALKRERDLLEVRVEERTRELQEAQIEKMEQMARFAEYGQLASGIIHDLGNPLTAVSLNLEQVVDAKNADLSEARQHIEEAITASSKMRDLLQAAVKGIKTQDVIEEFVIHNVVEEVKSILAYRCTTNQVEIVADCPNNLKLWGNPLKFHQILSNVLANALDSYRNTTVEQVGRKVYLSIKDLGETIGIVVRDQGGGIPANILPHLFDPFFTTKDAEHGSGIGLFVVKGMIEKDFKGMVAVESQEGAGTTLTISIPKPTKLALHGDTEEKHHCVSRTRASE